MKNFFAILILLIVLTGCSNSLSLDLPKKVSEIQFSLTRTDTSYEKGYLGKLQNTFTTEDGSMYYTIPLSSKTGTYIEVFERDGIIMVGYSGTYTVSTHLKGVIIHNTGVPDIAGNYTLKVYTEEEVLIGEGDFEVIEGKS